MINFYPVWFQASCSVCSAPAAIHLHYGAISCYSCRFQLSILSLLNFLLVYIFNSPSILSLLNINFLLVCVSLPIFLLAGPFSEEESPSKSGESLNNATDVHLVLFSNMQSKLSQVLQICNKNRIKTNSTNIRLKSMPLSKCLALDSV